MRRIFDRVHGEVLLTPLASRMVDHAWMHRLDRIRQLGVCAFVYPSATHTRREHSIGVYYLAGEAARRLAELHPDVIDASDIACVQIAGLLHDLGHGPFSHLFEEHVRAHLDPQWTHEAQTAAMVDVLLDVAGMESPCDRAFVALILRGMQDGEEWPAEEVGRTDARKRVLTELVHNRRCGIDVDKLDYLARDALAVFGATHSIDTARIVASMMLGRDAAGNACLAFDARVTVSLAQVFALRARLHKQVYQHREVLAAECILRAAWARDAGALISEHLTDPMRYARLVDATLLDVLSPETLSRLHRHPRMHQLPITLLVPMAPRCAACAAWTDVPDRFCRQCGETTATRVGERDDGDAGMRVSVRVDARALTKLLRRQRADVHVFVANVYCGTPIGAPDPHGGVPWRVHDVFAPVVLCDPRTGNPCRHPCVPFETQRSVQLIYVYTEACADDPAALVDSLVPVMETYFPLRCLGDLRTVSAA